MFGTQLPIRHYCHPTDYRRSNCICDLCYYLLHHSQAVCEAAGIAEWPCPHVAQATDVTRAAAASRKSAVMCRH